MRKGIKISLHIVSAFLLVVILLPVIIGLAIQLPSVQNFAVRKASQWASSKLEAKVSIDRIDIKFFSRAEVKGFYVEDYSRDTLFYIGDIKAEVLHTGLLGGKFTLGKTTVSDMRFKMHEDPDSTTNFRKIIEKIRRKNPPENRIPFEINITDLTVENMSYRLERLDPLDRRGSVNFRDLHVERFDVKASAVRILGDSVRMDIDQMSFREKTGLEVPLFTAKVENLSGNYVEVRDLRLLSGCTDLNLESLAFYAGGWDMYKNFIEAVRLEGVIRHSTIDMATIAAFTPTVAGMDLLFTNMEGKAGGKVKDLAGRIENITLAGNSASFDYRMTGLPDIEETVFDVGRLSVRTSSDGIRNALAGVGRDELPARIIHSMEGLGNIAFNGDFHGSYKNFIAEGDLDANDTRLRFDLKVSPVSGRRVAYSGNIGAYGLNAGDLAGVEKLGRVGVRGGFSGQFGGGSLMLDTDITIPLLEFNGYRYRDIAVKGELDDRMFTGHVGSDDNNIDFDLDGLFDLNDSIPRYDFSLNLRNADLAALNFAPAKDTVSMLRTDVRAVGRGINPDNFSGIITLTDITYINDEDSVFTGRMEVRGRNTADSKYLSFNSYFADAEYRSRTSYAQLIPELKRTLRSYIPTLIRDGNGAAGGLSRVAEADNYSLLSVNIKQANRAVGIFVPGLILAQGSRLSFMFNPTVGQLSLNALAEYVEYKNNFVSNLEVNTRNEGDSLSVFVRADDMYAGGIYMPNFSVIGGLKENRINASARFMDSVRMMTALVGVVSTFTHEPVTGITQAHLNFTPSSITIDDRVWNIYSRGITMDSTRIDIRDFNILGAGQNLTVYGTMSRSSSDTLHVDIGNFDLEPLTNLTARLGYKVGGRMNGHADLMAGKGEAMLHARVEFDSVSLNDNVLPDGLFESTWDFQNERARFALSGRQRGDTVVLGYYRPSTKQYLGKVNMNNIDISLIEPFFQGIMRQTSGRANVDAEITGQRRMLKVNGSAYVPLMRTTVDYLNVPYELRDATVTVKDNVIRMDDTPVYDPEGNSARVDMDVDLNSTQNIHYNIYIRPQNILAMDIPNEDYNDMFYGHVYASGDVAVRGDRRGVTLDIRATTEGNSYFYMPLGDYSMGLSDIITFREPAKETVKELNEYEQRKLSIIRRRKRREAGEGGGLRELNMTLDVRPNLAFELLIDSRAGDKLQARGNGSLSFHFNPSADDFRMNGVYEITEGSYQFSLQGIINKRFTIEPDSRITWINDPRDAQLNVSAVYNLRASLAPLLSNYFANEARTFSSVPVECRIRLNGSLDDPQITFDIEVPNVDPEYRSYIANELSTQENVSTQFLALLALGSFYSSDNGNIGSAGGTNTAVDFLASQLSNLISNDNLHIVVRYNQRSELTSDEWGVGLGTQLFNDRLLLEVEGNYNAQNNPYTDNSVNNLTGDFVITWLMDKNGNLRLRGFTRTVDRFEDQGLQESGIGINYREDFNNVGDIVRNFRERFSGKEKRKKKRAAEEESSGKND